MSRNIYRAKFLILCFFLVPISFIGQDDGENLLDLLGQEEEVTEYTKASFKTTLVVNLESIENTHKGVLDFKVMHRFGNVNGGIYEFFGLDQASTRLAFKYGITDRIEIGIGRRNQKAPSRSILDHLSPKHPFPSVEPENV